MLTITMKLTHGNTLKKHRDFLHEILACLFSLLEITPSELSMNSWHDILSCQLFPLFEVRSDELAMVSSYDSQLFPLLEMVYGESANGFLPVRTHLFPIRFSQWHSITASVHYTWDTKLKTVELREHTSDMSIWMITCNFWSKFM